MRLYSTALPELTAEVITSIPTFSQGTYKLPSAMPANMDEDNQVYPIAAPQIPPPDPTLQLAKELCLQSQMGKELYNTGVLNYYTLKSALVVPSLGEEMDSECVPREVKSKDRVLEPLFYNKSNKHHLHIYKDAEILSAHRCFLFLIKTKILTPTTYKRLKSRCLAPPVLAGSA